MSFRGGVRGSVEVYVNKNRPKDFERVHLHWSFAVAFVSAVEIYFYGGNINLTLVTNCSDRPSTLPSTRLTSSSY